ncbi:FIP (Fungus-Induced Protein) Related [Caenorhabditis elegans]|uniref:FIP (Fungus-Induced Protein) Related n=1 Tax=Caenorhabditis elegans TaxID=6239 RepID=G8JLY0_CAEEL|nr:FIP (Fungus-Induced Protein) Related [Caenorhabditis elegans]CCE72293.1 FIP (Fungus-Induced Protein) Related [Caenorhabditis elegans]|eukprot:NP_001263680.1 Uncharacterized protein CELE_Y46G5A.38 [Caenorhabditis elegans]
MLSLITCVIVSLCLFNGFVEAGPYGNGYYNNYRNYNYPNRNGYATYQNNYYQGYRSPYQYQRQGYNNNYYYQNSYAQQPYYTQTYSNGINYDSQGNSFIGTKENGIYLFCNGHGCPGRG